MPISVLVSLDFLSPSEPRISPQAGPLCIACQTFGMLCYEAVGLRENGPLWFPQVTVPARLRQPIPFCGLWFQSVESSETLHRLSLSGTMKWDGDQIYSFFASLGELQITGSFLYLSQSAHSGSMHSSQASSLLHSVGGVRVKYVYLILLGTGISSLYLDFINLANEIIASYSRLLQT